MVSDIALDLETLNTLVKIQRFEQTSSTKLEMQIVLWALKEIKSTESQVIIYTDSQNIIHLPKRRQRLLLSNFRSKNGQLLNNAELYQEFFAMTDKINCEFVKIQGHQPSSQKNRLEKIFALVDRASRNATRNYSQE